MKSKIFRAAISIGTAVTMLIQRDQHNERGDVTTTVIIIAVLVTAAVAAGVVITSFISEQTNKIG
ncbi:MAG: hypothetical protein F4138_07640 [Acidimicrobiia bacterium]|nr:hypothetical protein [Acidimicrobiia bacterium]MYC57544.1 hypothetical protein [Acidimicrobiia bacterium]MYG94835.1 hypothetical protein [Acidimicrobiia bacterium]MYI30092.1 hypothetical protein [Acidimicrobiia bacterium]